ncbi:hypothetical protein E2C01_033739 [Portunus trituberculatus]|uniref:Uncharacterized protein n=1 Tax=Portunus trituberculatus TaxID=210409 RepID=A0A5B7F4Z2_PORTR|nr:hypothetical protein [Portunus trituberculatus]
MTTDKFRVVHRKNGGKTTLHRHPAIPFNFSILALAPRTKSRRKTRQNSQTSSLFRSEGEKKRISDALERKKRRTDRKRKPSVHRNLHRRRLTSASHGSQIRVLLAPQHPPARLCLCVWATESDSSIT